jgi:hypothetical protein
MSPDLSRFHSGVIIRRPEFDSSLVHSAALQNFLTSVPIFRKKLPFPETFRSDINHIIPKQIAGESIYPLASYKFQGPEGVDKGKPPGREFSVPTQPVFQFRPAPSTPARISPKPTNASVVSICDSPAFSRVIEPESDEPVRDGLGCARAIRAAFVLEGSLGLALYAIWHFRHVIGAIHLIH